MQKNELKQLSRFVIGVEGNVSKRTGNRFVIKKSGTPLVDGHFISCDIDGFSSESEQPSIETSFHAYIYQHSNYKVIVHTHPTNTLAILCTDRIYDFANKRLFPDQVVFNGNSACIVPYATPGEKLTSEIALATKYYDIFPPLLLLKNHGIICCSHSIRHAIIMTEICEKAAEIFLKSDQPNFLSSREIEEIQNHVGEIHRKNILR